MSSSPSRRGFFGLAAAAAATAVVPAAAQPAPRRRFPWDDPAVAEFNRRKFESAGHAQAVKIVRKLAELEKLAERFLAKHPDECACAFCQEDDHGISTGQCIGFNLQGSMFTLGALKDIVGNELSCRDSDWEGEEDDD